MDVIGVDGSSFEKTNRILRTVNHLFFISLKDICFR